MDNESLPPPTSGLMADIDRLKRAGATELELECARASMPHWVQSAAECFRDALRESRLRHGSPVFAGVWYGLGRDYVSKLVLLQDVYERGNQVADAVLQACSEAWRARLEEEYERGRVAVLEEQQEARDRKQIERTTAHLRSNRK